MKDILASEIYVEVPVSRMGLDDSLRDVFGLDSLGFVELRVQCQVRFGIDISNDDFTPENFSTIRTVVALVDRLLPATVAAP
ncbi:acyl carrier protein [Dactylosporangium vinaceum]|uniref:Acyl carrier protein n=1 Tax=Dactylosporangium vinaceum TaxID=53362 RepID=A0ABV5MQV1_9ACTN